MCRTKNDYGFWWRIFYVLRPGYWINIWMSYKLLEQMLNIYRFALGADVTCMRMTYGVYTYIYTMIGVLIYACTRSYWGKNSPLARVYSFSCIFEEWFLFLWDKFHRPWQSDFQYLSTDLSDPGDWFAFLSWIDFSISENEIGLRELGKSFDLNLRIDFLVSVNFYFSL